MKLNATFHLRPSFAQGCVILRMDAYNALKYSVLLGGVKIPTHRFFVKYRAFQRYLRASLEGFIESEYYGNHLI